MHIIAISGGIGSGKSVVSRIVAVMGYAVYDCDSEAKRLMDSSNEIKTAIAEEISTDCIDSHGLIDRPKLSGYVFCDKKKLDALNRIVHGAVREDFARWCDRHKDDAMLFVETAILYQSGMDAMVDEVWEIEATRQTRISRVMSRNGLTSQQVESRIASQDAFIPSHLHPHTSHIDNNGILPLLPQIIPLLQVG